MTIDELMPFTQKRVDLRLNDGRMGHGVLRFWDDDTPGERQLILDASGPRPIGFAR
jgi:hypothetical protein